ncbi:EamA family transporter RarD [Suttonella sp. R2A3]|uniref:EamA family transporter RarD n=1 Tax=Suttonella sp. R2A3 TaxID=2908648 RepID=UPI001F423700|nr:EamA family transporter RarD [Suttonella sp. R2A3]UJF25051.1 EamA family transporter RarD [Suttonella sp. R2A3]
MNTRWPAIAAIWCCFLVWGLFPIYFRAMDAIRSDEFLYARIVTSVVCLIGYFIYQGRLRKIWVEILRPTMLVRCAMTSLFLACNWYVYIWAIQNNQTIEASLGYFITPIFNVLFGFWLFGERMGRLQWMAVALVFLGVIYQIVMLGVVPWASFGIGVAWAIYGGLRKKFGIAPVTGLFTELLILLPLALLGWALIYADGQGFNYHGHMGLLIGMLLSGLTTLVPLLLFLYGVSQLSMTTVGMTQYVTPTIQFLIAVFLFTEPFGIHRLVSFILIWIGLALYSVHLFSTFKKAKHVS